MTGLVALVATDPILCTHVPPGTVATAAAAGKLKLAGVAVLLLSDLAGASVACTVNDPSHGITKCVTVAAVTAGRAAKLAVGHVPVLLASLKATTDGAPPPITLTVTPGPRKLTAGAAP